VRGRSALRGLHAIALACLAGATALAQPATRRATNIAALLAYPTFYTGRPIVVVGNVGVVKDELRVSSEGGSIRLVSKGSAPDGFDEIRGEFWDLGRMKPDDPRLTQYNLRTTFRVDPDGPWPKPGEVTALIASSVMATQPAQSPTIRSIVLDPDRFVDQKVTVTGQFSGRNLLGDLPDAPARSRYDFVLRATDAAIWVVNMRPRIRDTNGKEIKLGLDARIDTGRWLELRGTIQQGRGLLWVDAEAGTLKLAKPPTETPTATDEPVRVAMGPPPEAIFSAPTEGETDVTTTTTVRIQFSRDLDPATLRGHVHARYVQAESAQRGEPDTPPIALTAAYNAANRVVELKFAQPLERFRTVKIELGADIIGTDGQPLKPFTMTFGTGGS
jgi:Big-like domain-containing protein